jgi:hypothetical protein
MPRDEMPRDEMPTPICRNLEKIEPFYLNGWEQYGYYGKAYQKPQIFKNKDGLITMNGLITGDFSKVMFRLPEGWRPQNQLIFTVMSYDNVARRLDIDSQGNAFININGDKGSISGNGWVSLSGISFYTELGIL